MNLRNLRDILSVSHSWFATTVAIILINSVSPVRKRILNLFTRECDHCASKIPHHCVSKIADQSNPSTQLPGKPRRNLLTFQHHWHTSSTSDTCRGGRSLIYLKAWLNARAAPSFVIACLRNSRGDTPNRFLKVREKCAPS